ncbi:MAG: TrkA C-terminal domain-containing protein [Gordonia sp. (in: high G+C Gram-positive bacteria)]|uniref:aspartate:alanine exchanger family transporter n=1 Tax=Gordonia sp. (in: high G+C Gram-positive bacteria) TaxID=84139 RepID=UPI003BB5F217
MQWLIDSPLLTLFLAIAVGCLFGKIPFGPVSFGPAGALFAALALSALNPDIALPPIVGSLALCVFCYMVGIAAGPAFISAIRTGWKQVVVSLIAITGMAAVALGVGRGFGLDIGTIAGSFAGAGTATPALGAVQGQLLDETGVPISEAVVDPAIGYAVAYPITVFLTILACQYLISAGRRKPTPQDSEPTVPIVVKTLELTADPGLTVAAFSAAHPAVISRITRAGQTVVAHDDQILTAGDLLTLTARADDFDAITDKFGRLATSEPWMDRSTIDFRRITLSERTLSGRPLHDLRLDERFDATVSRVRRGDVDIIATPDLVLMTGDRLRVTAPRDQFPEIAKALGDSERQASDINPVGLSIGLALGLVLAFVAIPMPGGGTLTLGTATAPLIVGVVLGILGRTGPIVWTLPGNVSSTLNQYSLLVFLAAVGLGAGGGLVTALKDDALALVILGLTIAVVHAVICIVGLRTILKNGTANALGGLTGSQLNPAPYAYAMDKVPDQRLAVAYATLFPIAMIFKVLVAQIMVVYFS